MTIRPASRATTPAEDASQGHWIETPLGRLHTGVHSAETTADKLKVGDWLFDAAPARASYVGEIHTSLSISPVNPLTRFVLRWHKWSDATYQDSVFSDTTRPVYLVKVKVTP